MTRTGKTWSGLKPTRFPELAYQKRGDHWRIIDMTNSSESGIGPSYPTREALLADFERFAGVYGVS